MEKVEIEKILSISCEQVLTQLEESSNCELARKIFPYYILKRFKPQRWTDERWKNYLKGELSLLVNSKNISLRATMTYKKY